LEMASSVDTLLTWACSSVVEHCVDIAGVASSILATPTIFITKFQLVALSQVE
jgi:hypothetical protein